MLMKVNNLGSFQDCPIQSQGLVLGAVACEVREGSSQSPGDAGRRAFVQVFLPGLREPSSGHPGPWGSWAGVSIHSK